MEQLSLVLGYYSDNVAIKEGVDNERWRTRLV